ncbi:MAG: glycosyltransferase, partial [Anaerolineae bacterium]|nr:glycosyltransferase [Anaerolineae bacterium]
MRILYLIHNYPPHHVAGTEMYTVNVTRELAQHPDHQVAVLHPVYTSASDFARQRRTDADGVTVYEILGGTHRLRFAFGSELAQEGFMAQVRAVLDEFQPALAHVQHLMGFPVLPLLRELHARKIPILYTLHDFWLICPRYHLLRADNRLCTGPRHGLWTCAVCRQGVPLLPFADAVLGPLERLEVLAL